MEIPLLGDISVIFGLAVAVLFVCHLLRIPSIVGFLLTGVVAGPHGLGLIKAVHEVELLAEIGVVMLLFTIGIEFSLKNLLRVKKAVMVAGSLQVFVTLLIVYFIEVGLGADRGTAIFLGFLMALSSTAIVLKLLQERAEIDTPHGRTTLAILIFQDIIVVPMMLITPMLAGGTGDLGESLMLLAAKGLGVVVLVFLCARYVVPVLLFQVARTRSRELFLLTIVIICLATAWLTSSIGLSFALGAFLAGLIISESEYSHHALSNILPFRDIFTSLFFVSIGMLFDIKFLLAQPGTVFLIALGILTLKAILAGVATVPLGFPLRTVLLVGLGLSQVGEFSFILSKTGVDHGLLSGQTYQMFLAVAVVTMAATPFVIAGAPRFATLVEGLRGGPKGKARRQEARSHPCMLGAFNDHIIIIGYGLNGRNVARAARAAGIDYAILEMNPETVREERAKGEPIFFGDAVREEVLEQLGIYCARVVIIAISDPVATRQVVSVVREENPKVHIIARTRYSTEMKPLYELGANEVIPEEFETSVEIFTRILEKYLVPREEIEKFVAEVRADGYQMLRSLSLEHGAVDQLDLQLPGMEISSLRVSAHSPLIGKTLVETELRQNYGVTVLAVQNKSGIVSNPEADIQIHANDLLLVIGRPEQIAAVASLTKGKAGAATSPEN